MNETPLSKMKEEKPKLDRKTQINIRLGEILKEYNGMESNIPVNPQSRHEYWELKGELYTIIKDGVS